MKGRLTGLVVSVALATSAVAVGGTSTWGLAIRRAVVNPDHSVTIEWSLESADVSVTSITVGYSTVGSWSLRSGQTRFTTKPLPAGFHTITIEALETVRSDTNLGSSCEPAGQSAYWLCRRSWRRSATVNVGPDTKALCLVPRVVGLQLEAAEARIAAGKCSLGVVRRASSKRGAGTVLAQRPRPRTRLPTDAAMSLVVSTGRSSG